MLDRFEQVFEPVHVEKRLLLPGKRRVGQIFGRRRRAHRKRHVVPGLLRSALIGQSDLLLQAAGKRLAHDPAADLLSGGGQRFDVFDIEPRQALRNALVEPVLREKLPVCACAVVANPPGTRTPAPAS